MRVIPSRCRWKIQVETGGDEFCSGEYRRGQYIIIAEASYANVVHSVDPALSLPGRVAVIKRRIWSMKTIFLPFLSKKLVVPFGTFKHGGAKGLAR